MSEPVHADTSPTARLAALGLRLPPPLTVPPDVRLPFAPVHVVDDIAYISGHGPQGDDGSIIGPFGKVGEDVTIADAYQAARLTGLSILGDLERTLGSLDRITAWGRVLGMVNASPTFARHPEVLNGFSDLITEVFGPDRGMHARSAVGVASLPFGGIPVEIEAQVHIRR